MIYKQNERQCKSLRQKGLKITMIKVIQSKKLILILLISVITHVELSQDVMKKLSIQFSKPLEACKKEMELSDSVTKEFANFWKEGYVLKEPHTGCAILCMSSKLDLLDGEYQMHHGNAHEFAKKHGADDAMAKQLVDIIHNCGQTTALDNDPCITTLNVAQCFKNKIHDLKWAPDPDVIMAEILAEV